MNLGSAIKAVRNKLDMSQEELSKKSGISQTSISQMESGVKNPSARSIKKICQVLKVPEAVIYIMAIQDSDVPPSRKDIFEEVFPQIKELAIRIVGDRKSRFIAK